ncbi:MAG: sigma 54-interacting transcriptional regulator [Proteobacteria bacterium]|nr:sigma 54-interacting transcriptional regulator [Pseudomonadota bacterium]
MKKIPIRQLQEISSWVASIQDLDKLLDLILKSAAKMMNANASSLMLIDRETNMLFFQSATGVKKDEIKNFQVKLGQGISGSVAKSGEPLLIPDVVKDPRWFREISDNIGFKTRSIACVPLKVNGKTMGVLQVIDKANGSFLTEEDMLILSEFAELAALAIANARKIEQVKIENTHLKEEIGSKYQIIGKSSALQSAITDALKVANSSATTLILGESGTGKELLARLIHQSSPRKEKPLVVLNCAALPESLLEDELFGHEKGAFTGATHQKIGKFELAHEGTIFLDEIGEMNLGMQAKLLRVLQEGTFYPVGSNAAIFVNVRVLSATNKNLEEQISKGKFREDLYYRLNVVQIHMPPLRNRMEDVPLLAEYFLNYFKDETGMTGLMLSKAALDKITRYSWPGNIRELRNAIERAVVMGDGHSIKPEDLPISARKPNASAFPTGMTLHDAIDWFKKEFISQSLKQTAGNRSRAAENMEIQRTYLSRLISKYDIKDQ